MEKIGNFDWIASYEEIQDYLRPPYLVSKEFLSILVIGCGTSTLAESIATDLQPHRILAIDNDKGCIDHMKKLGKSNVIYEYYDLVELGNNCLDSSLIPNEQFDVIVDKGTFDAIHVEGSIVTLVKEVSRLLKSNGRYILFTINQEQFLRKLFHYPSLHFIVRWCEPLPCDNNSFALILEKTGKIICDDKEFSEYENVISSEYFQGEKSMLTEDYLQYLQQEFESMTAQTHSSTIDSKTAYHIMFDPKPELQYSYSLFCEDLQQFYQRESFTFEEMINFLKQLE